MKIYLDTCSLHRPLDDKTQVRVALEAEAVLSIVKMCEGGIVLLVTSDALTFEVGHNPHPQRRAFVTEILARAPIVVALSDIIEQRAKELEGRGFKALDALHVASAEAEQVDYFCTCDDRLLKRAKVQSDIRIKIVSPLELAQEVML
jgi:predicted nucleic acid-binding protein